MVHDLTSAGISEPIWRVKREQPRDDVFEAVPPDRFLWPFVIQHQDVMECRVIFVSLEWLYARTQITLDSPFDYSDNGHAGSKWAVRRTVS